MQSNLHDVLENEPSVSLSEDAPMQPEVFGLKNPASTELLSYSANSSPAGTVGGAFGGGQPGDAAEVYGRGPSARFEPHPNYHRARSDPQQRALANTAAMRAASDDGAVDDLRANSFSHRIQHTFKRGWGRMRGVHIQRGVRGGRWKHVRRGDVTGWVQVAERQQPVGAAPHGGNRGRLGPDDVVRRLRGGG